MFLYALLFYVLGFCWQREYLPHAHTHIDMHGLACALAVNGKGCTAAAKAERGLCAAQPRCRIIEIKGQALCVSKTVNAANNSCLSMSLINDMLR